MSYTNGLDKPEDYFNTILYAGTDSAQSETGVGFQPDFTWIKVRNYGGSASFEHVLTDAVRGANKTLTSNSTEAEAINNATGYLSSFDSDGFSLAGGGTSIDAVAGGARNYVAWNWLASNTTASNTVGDINSTVSVNTTSGFSIVSYTGNGSVSTVGHSLGTTPSMIIIKNRSGVADWLVYHKSIGNTGGLYLNSTSATITASGFFNNTSPTSSVFTIGTGGTPNNSGSDYIAYCFAEKKGFSKFGSYTGNGNADGTFVYTGFKPAFVIFKNTTGESWIMFDNKRDPDNVVEKKLYPSFSLAEATASTLDDLDFVSNGFKIRGTEAEFNQSGSKIIYMAFAENPFVTSTGIPTCAR